MLKKSLLLLLLALPVRADVLMTDLVEGSESALQVQNAGDTYVACGVYYNLLARAMRTRPDHPDTAEVATTAKSKAANLFIGGVLIFGEETTMAKASLLTKQMLNEIDGNNANFSRLILKYESCGELPV